MDKKPQEHIGHYFGTIQQTVGNYLGSVAAAGLLPPAGIVIMGKRIK